MGLLECISFSRIFEIPQYRPVSTDQRIRLKDLQTNTVSYIWEATNRTRPVLNTSRSDIRQFRREAARQLK